MTLDIELVDLMIAIPRLIAFSKAVSLSWVASGQDMVTADLEAHRVLANSS